MAEMSEWRERVIHKYQLTVGSRDSDERRAFRSESGTPGDGADVSMTLAVLKDKKVSQNTCGQRHCRR